MIKTYTIPEASELTGIPAATLYRGVKSKKLRAGIERGKKRGLRVTEEAIEEFWKELESEAKE